MATYINSTALWHNSCRLCFLYIICVMCACCNRCIHYCHAEAIVYPVLTAHLYFLFWIRLFLSLEVVSHQHILGKIFNIFYRHFFMPVWFVVAFGFAFVVGNFDNDVFGCPIFLGYTGCQQFWQTCISFNPTWGLAILCMHFVSNIFAFD